MNTSIQQWQRRTPEADRQYYNPTPTSYFEQISDEEEARGGGVAGVLAWIGANAGLFGAAWSAHEACVHGNAHSGTATSVLTVVAGSSLVAGVAGLLSKKTVGVIAGAVMSPLSLVLAGFGVILWSPGWPAAWGGLLLFGSLNGGIIALKAAIKWALRRMKHEAGMQHAAITGGLQDTQIRENGATTRAAIGYQEHVDVAYSMEARQYHREAAWHRQHPDAFPPPVFVPPIAPGVVPDARPALEMVGDPRLTATFGAMTPGFVPAQWSEQARQGLEAVAAGSGSHTPEGARRQTIGADERPYELDELVAVAETLFDMRPMYAEMETTTR